MLKKFILLLRLGRAGDKYSQKNLALTLPAATADSFGSSFQFRDTSLKDLCVRIIHAGGREEIHHHAVPVSEIMEKYPGTRVALPDVFRSNPHVSILGDDEVLLVGNKYLIVPFSTVEKLKRRHDRGKRKTDSGEIIACDGDEDDLSEDSSVIRSANQFYVCRDKWVELECVEPEKGKGRRTRTKKRFVPPIPQARPSRGLGLGLGLGWKPSLPSVGFTDSAGLVRTIRTWESINLEKKNSGISIHGYILGRLLIE